jgi:hypothetical protein
MKKYIIIIALVCTNINAQTIAELMKGYENKYALEHAELIVDPKYSQSYQDWLPYPIHERIAIIDVDDVWLEKITSLVQKNPSILYSYLDTDNYNLSAYILLSHIFKIKLSKISNNDENFHLWILKTDIFAVDNRLDSYSIAKDVPAGVDKAAYILNKVWKEIAPEANARIKALLP